MYLQHSQLLPFWFCPSNPTFLQLGRGTSGIWSGQKQLMHQLLPVSGCRMSWPSGLIQHSWPRPSLSPSFFPRRRGMARRRQHKPVTLGRSESRTEERGKGAALLCSVIPRECDGKRHPLLSLSCLCYRTWDLREHFKPSSCPPPLPGHCCCPQHPAPPWH